MTTATSSKTRKLLKGSGVMLLAIGLGCWLAHRAPVAAPKPAPAAAQAGPLPAVEEPPLPVTERDLAPFHAEAASSQLAVPLPAVVASPVVVAPTDPVPAPSAQSVPAELVADGAELAATQRMYLAHNSLRTPEVADPDSEANRRILQSMVQKALQAPAPTPAR